MQALRSTICLVATRSKVQRPAPDPHGDGKIGRVRRAEIDLANSRHGLVQRESNQKESILSARVDL
jgi:hypothetical protein